MIENREYEEIWNMILSYLTATYPRAVAELFFKELRIQGMDGESVTLATDSGFKYQMISQKYKASIEKAFHDTIGLDIKVNLIFDGNPVDLEQLKKQMRNSLVETDPENEPPAFLFKQNKHTRIEVVHPKPDPVEMQESARLNGSIFPSYCYEYTFENFIVGSSNKFAHAACTAVADRPATNFNPLFIYGPSGLGKTHLMCAVINRIREKTPNAVIRYIKGEDFTNQLIESIAKSAMPEFRAKYRSCDVLLIDDIQFVAGKTSTQEEFFHTFNALFEEHKQIVLTSDRPPREIKTLEDRLKTRFEWGLLADIQPPDLELRIAILKKKCESIGISIPDDILMFLAENLRSNIRQLEGVIKKLSAMTFVTGEQVSMAQAQACITEFMGSEEPVSVTVDRVLSAVEKKFGIPTSDLTGTRRTKDIATARHVAVYLIRNVTDMSLPNIGKIFNRDHTTVISSCETVERRMLSDAAFGLQVNELLKSLKNGD